MNNINGEYNLLQCFEGKNKQQNNSIFFHDTILLFAPKKASSDLVDLA